MTTLQLREWSTTPALALSPPQRDALRGVFGALVQPNAGGTDTYDVTPGNTIGAVQVDGVTLLVEPKIPIARVLFLLGYAVDPSGIGTGDAQLGAAPDVVSGVTRLFTTLTERALRRGLLSGYRTVDADLHTVRGRIDLAEQLRRRPGVELPLAVRFQEYDEDIQENRLLLAATNVLRRLALRDVTARRTLHRLSDTLQNVTPVYYPPSALPPITWTRLNQHLPSSWPGSCCARRHPTSTAARPPLPA
jgi:5-methylcytosine-specific restriction enzyme subunit McrC